MGVLNEAERTSAVNGQPAGPNSRGLTENAAMGRRGGRRKKVGEGSKRERLGAELGCGEDDGLDVLSAFVCEAGSGERATPAAKLVR